MRMRSMVRRVMDPCNVFPRNVNSAVNTSAKPFEMVINCIPILTGVSFKHHQFVANHLRVASNPTSQYLKEEH